MRARAGPRAILDIGYVVLSGTASENKGLKRARRWREGRPIGIRVAVGVGPRGRRVYSECGFVKCRDVTSYAFFEWKRDVKPARPYYFYMKGEAPFWFAGIWENEAHLIPTTAPNQLLQPIHDRMR